MPKTKQQKRQEAAERAKNYTPRVDRMGRKAWQGELDPERYPTWKSGMVTRDPYV